MSSNQQPLSKEDLKQRLHQWANRRQEGEDRQGALRKMLECVDNELTTLDLSEFNLKFLPEEIGQFTWLEKLVLGGNRLQTIPGSIGDLTELQDLFLDSNQLTTIPEPIGNLAKLQFFSLTANQLTTIPGSIGNLTKLQDLLLDNNQLQTIPDSLFSHAYQINLEQNRILAQEVQRLNQLARQSGVRLNISIFEPQQVAQSTSNQNQVILAILERCQNEEEKAEFNNFFNSPEVSNGDFKRFFV